MDPGEVGIFLISFQALSVGQVAPPADEVSGGRDFMDECRRPAPRLHGMQHSFAVATLVQWYRAGKNVSALPPRLSTPQGRDGLAERMVLRLGYLTPADTYWYLSLARGPPRPGPAAFSDHSIRTGTTAHAKRKVRLAALPSLFRYAALPHPRARRAQRPGPISGGGGLATETAPLAYESVQRPILRGHADLTGQRRVDIGDRHRRMVPVAVTHARIWSSNPSSPSQASPCRFGPPGRTASDRRTAQPVIQGSSLVAALQRNPGGGAGSPSQTRRTSLTSFTMPSPS